MSDEKQSNYDDGKADAMAAVAMIAIVVATVVYWLLGF